MSWERTLAALVEERTGIQVAPRQLRNDVRRKIDVRIRELELSGPEEWVRHLGREPADSPELAWLVEAVTVGYSYFFRDADQLRVVIEVLEDLRRGMRGRASLQVWCAGCATGQEPWSLAILAERAKLPVQILATDLNPRFLAQAEAGRYPARAGEQVPEDLLGGFVPGTEGLQVRPDLAAHVRFRRHNLVGAGPTPMALDGGRFDVVLCRNVFIYFSDHVRAQVASRFAGALEPTGWLFLGPGETLEDTHAPLVTSAWGRRFGYRRAPDAPRELAWSSPSPVPTTSPWALTPMGAETSDPLRRALRLFASGQLDRAEDVLVRATSTTPDPRVWLGLAHLRIRRHEFPRALEACAAALALDPLFAEAHLASGVIHRKLGDGVAAERTFRRALFLDPDAWRAAVLLAGVYGRQGREREQRRLLRQAGEALDRDSQDRGPEVPAFGVDALEGGPERALAALSALRHSSRSPDSG